jgi:hypothetical protein
MTSMGSVGELEKVAADGSGWDVPGRARAGVLGTIRAWLAVWLEVWADVARREVAATRRIVRDWWHNLGETSPRWFMVLFGSWLAAAAVLALGAAVYTAIRLS